MTSHSVITGNGTVPLVAVHHRRARRYILRITKDGSARVTIPRGGSVEDAKLFAQRNAAWIAQQIERARTRPKGPQPWTLGSEILFRGQLARIEPTQNPRAVDVGGEIISIRDSAGDLRPEIERHLRHLAARELPPRVMEFARLHQLVVQRVSVRNQRSRWGSCSRRATISLNWRLVQTPESVRDYIILHELMHLRQMNHSARFWREVANACPDYLLAERWLKTHSPLLR